VGEDSLFSVLRCEARYSAAAAAATTASAPTNRTAAISAAAVHRTGRARAARRGEDRKLACDIFAMTGRALRLPPAGADEALERTVAISAVIFVDRHRHSSLVRFIRSVRLVVERLRVLDQHAARRLGMKEADHPGQAMARRLID
jgi:hypothetical protein